jgi:hypothetical protein
VGPVGAQSNQIGVNDSLQCFQIEISVLKNSEEFSPPPHAEIQTWVVSCKVENTLV